MNLVGTCRFGHPMSFDLINNPSNFSSEFGELCLADAPIADDPAGLVADWLLSTKKFKSFTK